MFFSVKQNYSSKVIFISSRRNLFGTKQNVLKHESVYKLQRRIIDRIAPKRAAKQRNTSNEASFSLWEVDPRILQRFSLIRRDLVHRTFPSCSICAHLHVSRFILFYFIFHEQQQCMYCCSPYLNIFHRFRCS